MKKVHLSLWAAALVGLLLLSACRSEPAFRLNTTPIATFTTAPGDASQGEPTTSPTSAEGALAPEASPTTTLPDTPASATAQPTSEPATATPIPTSTPTSDDTPESTSEPAPTERPAQPDPTDTVATTPTSVATPTPSPTRPWAQGTPTPTPTTDSPGQTPTAVGTPSPTPLPSSTATATGTPPTATPTATPGTPTSTPTATPIPVPGSVEIRNDRSFLKENTLFVVGDAVNTGDIPVYGVRIVATFLDAGGRVLGARESQTLLPMTLPGQQNPFQIRFPSAPEAIDDYELTLSWSDVSIVDVERVTIVNQELRREGSVAVVGQIRNDHAFELTNVKVSVTFYDQNGDVVNAFVGSISEPLMAPSSTASFSIDTGEEALDFERYEVQSQGNRGIE